MTLRPRPRESCQQLFKMASLAVVRCALLVAFSVFLTLILGFGLPSALNFIARGCGFPEASVTECIVLMYSLFVLYVAMPRLPRGTVKVQSSRARTHARMHVKFINCQMVIEN